MPLPARPLRPIELHVLAALADGPCHGYGLVERIDRLTASGRPVRPGDLYRVLARLEDQGRLELVADPPDPDDDQRRTYYALTDLGREVLEGECRSMLRIARRVLGTEARA